MIKCHCRFYFDAGSVYIILYICWFWLNHTIHWATHFRIIKMTNAAFVICLVQQKILTNLRVLALYGPEFFAPWFSALSFRTPDYNRNNFISAVTALHSCSTDNTTLIALMLERKCVFLEMLFVFCFPFSMYVKMKFPFLTKSGSVFYFQLCNSEIREITFPWGWEFDNFELPWCGTIYHYKKRHQRIVIIVNIQLQ